MKVLTFILTKTKKNGLGVERRGDMDTMVVKSADFYKLYPSQDTECTIVATFIDMAC